MRINRPGPTAETLHAWLSAAPARITDLREALRERDRLGAELSHIRRDVRRLKVVCWGVVGLLGLVALLSALAGSRVFFPAAVDEIRARRFIVVDDRGTARVQLGLLGEGAGLELADSRGVGRAAIAVRPDGATAIEMLGEERHPRVTLEVLPDGSPRLELRGPDGMSTVTVGVRPDGAAHVLLADHHGHHRSALTITPGGSPGLTLNDATGTPRLGLTVTSDDWSEVDLYDRAGARRLGLSVSPQGAPVIGFDDNAGRPRMLVGLLLDGKPTLDFFDQRGVARLLMTLRATGMPRLIAVGRKSQIIWEVPCPGASPARKGGTTEPSAVTGARDGGAGKM